MFVKSPDIVRLGVWGNSFCFKYPLILLTCSTTSTPCLHVIMNASVNAPLNIPMFGL